GAAASRSESGPVAHRDHRLRPGAQSGAVPGRWIRGTPHQTDRTRRVGGSARAIPCRPLTAAAPLQPLVAPRALSCVPGLLTRATPVSRSSDRRQVSYSHPCSTPYRTTSAKEVASQRGREQGYSRTHPLHLVIG